MNRRDFLQNLALTLAAAWSGMHLPWPGNTVAGDELPLRLALLADAHLKSGNVTQPAAVNLARAVTEIRSLCPPPDLVLFAGDLAHRGRPDALDLGKEILSDLPAPLLPVPGESDGDAGGAGPWQRRWGEPRLAHRHGGVHFLGLETKLVKSFRGGSAFTLGGDQLNWLARELAALDPATPLVLLSHAPLRRLYHPWQQWLKEESEVADLLAPFRQILCLHGHVHLPAPLFSDNRQPKTENRHYGLPATSWPLPAAVQGTPAQVRPGGSPRGCGWTLASRENGSWQLTPCLWTS